MKEFPAKFIPANLANFPQYKFDRDICYLREAIYEWFLQEKPPSNPRPEVKTDKNPSAADLKKKNLPLGTAPSSTYQESKELGPFESPFDLAAFKQARSPPDFDKMISIVCAELNKLKWETKLGYGNTSLWIYPANLVPKSLPEW